MDQEDFLSNVAFFPDNVGSGSNPDNVTSLCDSCYNLSKIENVQHIAAGVTIFTGSLSITGSLLIILTYALWKDVRKSTARTILLFLSTADLLAAVSYVIASIAFLVLSTNSPACSNSSYALFCRLQSLWSTYFSMVSYLWITNLAIYYFVVLVLRKNFGKKLMVTFHLTSWIIPLLICVPTTATKWLGSGLSTQTGAWCFVSDENFYNQSIADFEGLQKTYYFVEAIAGKLWEVLAYVTGFLCYALIIGCNRCRWHKIKQAGDSYAKRRISEAISQMDLKLLLIPLLFFLLKIWGLLRYIASALPNCHHYNVINTDPARLSHLCITTCCSGFIYYPFLMIMQSICDPLLGFINAFLFLFLSKVLCCRLTHMFLRVFQHCCCWPSSTSRKTAQIISSTNDGNEYQVMWITKRKQLISNGKTTNNNEYGSASSNLLKHQECSSTMDSTF